MFSARYSDITEAINNVDAVKYGKTRNFLNGQVTRLSPYISRGVISTKQVAQAVLKGHKPFETETFLKELAWRDYFQNVWVALGDAMDSDIKQPQQEVANRQIPVNLLNAATGIQAIDDGIQKLYDTGYVHNHVRMYVAGITCNIAKCHWAIPARWMYYHLLDADWASNALSWQWVAGSFSSKKYIANQQNINHYCGTVQTGTWLDADYGTLERLPIPKALEDLQDWQPVTVLPETAAPSINADLPTYLYNFYNLDPAWGAGIEANRVLLLEPSFFNKYPVSPKTIEFVLALAQNIPGIQVFPGEFNELHNLISNNEIIYKEHPASRHYKGTSQEREWLFPDVKGYHPSFSAYWKKCGKYIGEYYG